MSKIDSSPALTAPEMNSESEHLPTLDRPGVVAYCAAYGIPVTERWVRQSSQDGSLPSFVIRNRVMFSRADVRAWLQSLRRA